MLLGDRHLGTADQDVGDYADVAELTDGMLRRFRLQFARRLQVGNERKVHEACVLGSFLETELPRRLKKRQRLDVARDAADFAEDDVAVVCARAPDRRLDLVGDVRNDLHRAAEIAAGALAGKDCGVDASGREVRRLGACDAGEALVVSEVEVRLGAVVRHEHLAVLVGRHRAWVDVEVGVELLHEDLVSA